MIASHIARKIQVLYNIKEEAVVNVFASRHTEVKTSIVAISVSIIATTLILVAPDVYLRNVTFLSRSIDTSYYLHQCGVFKNLQESMKQFPQRRIG